LQEPLPDDGTSTPVSALWPDAGASETSEDSHAALVHAQQRLQPARGAGPAEPAAAAAGEQQQRQEVEPVGAAELLREGRPPSGVEWSNRSTTQYFDARECLPDGAPCGRRLADGSHVADPAALPAQVAATGGGAEGQETPCQGLASVAAALLARGAHHRRGISASSAASADTPTAGEEGGARQQHISHRFWRRFNRDYGEWESYWADMGVEPPELEGEPSSGGVVARALAAAEEALRTTYYSTSLFFALLSIREGAGCGGGLRARAGTPALRCLEEEHWVAAACACVPCQDSLPSSRRLRLPAH
jgi:hypothetical protein